MSIKPLHTIARRMPGTIENRIVRFILSTGAKDRVGDTIDQSGWRLENYLKNPVVLWAHDHDEPPIGKMVRIGTEGGSLVGDIMFADADTNEFADTVFKLIEGGFVNAGSVGFKPLRWEFNDDGGLDFKEQELLEFSVVGVPCHPEALAQIQRSGMSLDTVSRALVAETPPDEAARAEYIEAARKDASRLNIRKRAVQVRVNQFQLATR